MDDQEAKDSHPQRSHDPLLSVQTETSFQTQNPRGEREVRVLAGSTLQHHHHGIHGRHFPSLSLKGTVAIHLGSHRLRKGNSLSRTIGHHETPVE